MLNLTDNLYFYNITVTLFIFWHKFKIPNISGSSAPVIMIADYLLLYNITYDSHPWCMCVCVCERESVMVAGVSVFCVRYVLRTKKHLSMKHSCHGYWACVQRGFHWIWKYWWSLQEKEKIIIVWTRWLTRIKMAKLTFLLNSLACTVHLECVTPRDEAKSGYF